MYYGTIYLITNLITLDKYVGKTTETLKKRWKRHCSKWSNCRYLYSSIKKYGKENFSITPIMYANNKIELNHREKLCIELFKTQVPNGYNILPGGSDNILPRLPGRILTEQEKNKISTTLKSFYKELCGDPENFKKFVLSRPHRKEVFCHQTGNRYISIHQAVVELGLKSDSKILDVINGKYPHYRGYTFCLVKDASEDDLKIRDFVSTRKNKVLVICHQNGKTYDSLKEAGKDLGIKGKRISDVVTGRKKSYKGFTFSRVEDKYVI